MWDGNEVWLLVAGGATFAAFPSGTRPFSGFYLPLFIILLALIVRGVAFEYRSKRSSMKWRRNWDIAIVVGSFIPALLWGVAFRQHRQGTPLEPGLRATSSTPVASSTCWNPYALVGGLTTLTLFLTHGAVFLTLKTTGEIRERSNKIATQAGLAATVLAVVFLLWTQLAYLDQGVDLGAGRGRRRLLAGGSVDEPHQA